MMYVQIPIFSGYANIAICPGHGTNCYMIDDVQKNQNLYSEMNAKSYTFLPFYPNHHYILYPTTDDKMDDGVLFFHSEDLMKKHILEHLGTQYVTGRTLSVTVSTRAAPNVTTPMVDGNEHCQEFNTVYEKNKQNEKKILKNKNTKKNKKEKSTKKIKIEKPTKKIQNFENILEYNKFYLLSQNLENDEKTKSEKKNGSDNSQNQIIKEEQQQKYSRKSSNYLLNSSSKRLI